MDNLAQAQGIDYIEQYQGMPLQEMSEYLDTQGKKYTDNKQKVDALDIELANEKVLSKGNEAKLAAIERKKNRIKTITEKGDYENGTLLIDEAIKEYKTDKLLNQEKSDLTTYNEYLTKLDEELKEDRITQQDYEQIKQVTQATLKPAKLDEYGEAVSGVSTIQPAKYVNVVDVLEKKLVGIAVEKYGEDSKITQNGGEYFIVDSNGFTREKITKDRVNTLSKIAIENDQELQSYLNFKSQLNYKTKALSGTLPKLEDLEGKKEFEDFILIDGIKDLTSQEQVELYNISKTKQEIINSGMVYGEVKFSYDNVTKFDHNELRANSNYGARLQKEKEEEAKDNYSLAGLAEDSTLTHDQVREKNIAVKNQLSQINQKLTLQEEALDIQKQLQEIATFDSQGNLINTVDRKKYNQLLARQEDLLNNNNFEMLTENQVNVLKKEQKELTLNEQYYENKIKENQINFAKSVEGEEFINGVNGIFDAIRSSLGLADKLNPEDIKSFITSQDLDYIERISDIAASAGEGVSAKARQNLIHGWLTGTALGRKMARTLLKDAQLSTLDGKISTETGDKLGNIIKYFDETKGINSLTSSARSFVKSFNSSVNEWSLENPTAVTYNVVVGTEGSGAEISDKNAKKTINNNKSLFTVVGSGMTLDAIINEESNKILDESEEDNPTPPKYEMVSASTIISGPYKGATQVVYKLGETEFTKLVQNANFGEDMAISKSIAVIEDEAGNDEGVRQAISQYKSNPNMTNAIEVAAMIKPNNAAWDAVEGINEAFNPALSEKLLTNLNGRGVGAKRETEPLDINLFTIEDGVRVPQTNVQAKIVKTLSEGREGYTYEVRVFDPSENNYVPLTERQVDEETEEDVFNTLSFSTIRELQHALMSGIQQ